MSAAPSYISAAICSSAARVYRRRRPERTALYRLVQQYLETWLARRREGDPDAAPIPRHIERKLRSYLECGILACGFACARCADYGHDFLVAFSCKGRGMCPSCTTRRMAETTARRSTLRAIENGLRRRCPDAPRDSRCGAVTFVQRFGSALNAHTHLHCCVTDGVFSLDADGRLRFHPATDLDAPAVSAVRIEAEDRAGHTEVREDHTN